MVDFSKETRSSEASRRNQLRILSLGISMFSEMNRGVKRRDLADAYDDISHCPLLQVPRKSRRLDCQFSPRYEVKTEQRLWQDPSVTSGATVHDDVPVMDMVPLYNPTEDRSPVLFQPANLLKSLSSPRLEIKVHPDLVDDLKNYRYEITSAYTPEVKDQPPNLTYGTNNLAVIPWVDPGVQNNTYSQPMEADDDPEMMETEECTEFTSTSEGLQHQPQHCLLPQISPSTSSPVNWW